MLNTKQLLIACGQGEFPKVKHAQFGEGTVTVIKNNGNHFGCAIRFQKFKYDVWFWDLQDIDKRKHFMRELNLIE